MPRGNHHGWQPALRSEQAHASSVRTQKGEGGSGIGRNFLPLPLPKSTSLHLDSRLAPGPPDPEPGHQVLRWVLIDLGIRCLTVYALSTENIKSRDDSELDVLYDLFAQVKTRPPLEPPDFQMRTALGPWP